MKYLKTYKKIILYFITAITTIVLFFTLYYFHKTNIISTLEIKISPTQSYLANQIDIKAFGTLNRSFDMVYNDSTKAWNTKDLYLNRIEIKIPKHINKNDSFLLMINNKSITSYQSGIENRENETDHITIIKDLYSVNFGDKFVYFTVFYFKRLIAINFIFKKYITLILYLTMLIIVFFKVLKTKKNDNKSFAKNGTNNEN